MFFIADIIACSTCFRHYYAHHQELESIIRVVAACGIWCFFKLSVWCGAEGCVSGLRAAASRKPDTQPSAPHHTDNLKTEAPSTTGSYHLYNTLELLMMGIIVHETCWASNKICNKKRLLHLVGILFPQLIMLQSHATVHPRKTLVFFASTHRFLNHPKYWVRVLVVGLAYEVQHPLSDKRL
jgi:hypothetical protein